jgi:tRNA nucleotidyltransferase (CCA-adding enzyme)
MKVRTVSNSRSIGRIKEDILDDILPDLKEQSSVLSVANKLKMKVTELAKKSNLECIVTLEGSVAKDTWLTDEADIDIFMQVPKIFDKKQLKDICLKIAKDSLKGYPTIERYAEHPYIEANIGNYKVNIVPCYKTKKGIWMSAADRTPFHTEYMKKQLNDKLRKEIRILKKFMTAIGTYGAEIKIGGFSGMLCEILILHFNSFENLLVSASEWKNKEIIDVENYYKGSKKDIYEQFDEPLIVIDPVDRNRNVAAAVTEKRLWEFVSASRSFLEKPIRDFFLPKIGKKISSKKICKKIADHGTSFIFLKFGKIDAVVDVIWSQLFKSERCIKQSLKSNDFNVLRSASWSDEKDFNILVFELEMNPIPAIRKHFGPQIFRKKDSDNFLKTHRNTKDTIIGPWIDINRWAVGKKRKYENVRNLLENLLLDKGKRIGVAKFVSNSLENGFEIIENEQILDLYESNEGFSNFLIDFLREKKFWIK